MKRFYVGDGVYGFWRWLYARVIWRWLPPALKWARSVRAYPPLPPTHSWNVTADGKALYARRDV